MICYKKEGKNDDLVDFFQIRCAMSNSKYSFRPFMNRGRFQVQMTELCLSIEI